MTDKSLILVVNPGSSSRKYALFSGTQKIALINFEFEDGKIVAKVERRGEIIKSVFDDTDLGTVSNHVLSLIYDNGVLNSDQKIDAIGVRLVAPSMRFTKNELLTDETLEAIENIKLRAPLHIGVVLQEIKQVRQNLPNIPIVVISDSAFHLTKRQTAWNYGIDIDLADRAGIKRFGFHGLSVGSVVRNLACSGKLLPKMIICHLGSGSSVTAVLNGQSHDTTMGYSPLEGVMMATRTGTIDASAALAIKRELNLNDDELESFLNKQCGLLGISGTSNDIRQLVLSEEAGDKKAGLALDMFVYRVQLAIGQMSASLDGVDGIVFTGTVGERSNIIRRRITNNLKYLGFEVDNDINVDVFEPKTIANIGTENSKPVMVISTDEAAEIAYEVQEFFNK